MKKIYRICIYSKTYINHLYMKTTCLCSVLPMFWLLCFIFSPQKTSILSIMSVYHTSFDGLNIQVLLYFLYFNSSIHLFSYGKSILFVKCVLIKETSLNLLTQLINLQDINLMWVKLVCIQLTVATFN